MTQTEIYQQHRIPSGSGVYALLFTDIEGSTNLIQTLDEAYPALFLRHQEIVRTGTADHGGVVVDTQGDSFFVLFDVLPDALAAALSIQEAIAREDWGNGVRLRVRMGLHHGMVRVIEGNRVGLDVHRAARICAVAHGGQIVLSREASEGLEPADIDRLGIGLRDLGRHRLKDIRFPEALFDVIDPANPAVFPELRSLGARNTNLASLRGEIIGRDVEIAEARRLLATHPGRLVTIVGAGGSGKTSLAERVASLSLPDYPEGVYFVDLGSVGEPGLVFPTVANALGVRDFPGRAVELDIAAAIGDSRQLVVLDTFEHVLPAAEGLARILGACPELRLLVTSRATLGLAAEHAFPLEPLALPVAGDSAASADGALRLFIERAREVDPGRVLDAATTATFVEIVRKLEGMPLALELAASQLRILSPDQLLARLETRLKLLRGGRRDLARHRTLRDAIEWSDNLLEASDREALRQLAVFQGGFRLDDAEAVLDGPDALEAVGALVGNSLLRRSSVSGEPRFTMFDMVREFALEEVAKSDGLAAAQRRHLAHFAGIAETSGAMALHRDQRRHILRLAEEADNWRAALRFAIETRDIEAVARLVQSLHWYWIAQGHFTEGLSWIERAVELARSMEPSVAAATVERVACYTKAAAGDYVGAFPHARDALAAFEALGHEDGRQQAALMHAVSAAASGEPVDPMPAIVGAIEHARDRGDHYHMALGLIVLGEFARFGGDRAAAEEQYRAALAILERIENIFWPGALWQNIGHFRVKSGSADEAAALFADAYDLADEYDYPMMIALCVAGFAGVALLRGEDVVAANLLGAVERHLDKLGARLEPADKADIDAYVEQVRERLGEAAYAAQADAGAEADWDEIRARARALAE